MMPKQKTDVEIPPAVRTPHEMRCGRQAVLALVVIEVFLNGIIVAIGAENDGFAAMGAVFGTGPLLNIMLIICGIVFIGVIGRKSRQRLPKAYLLTAILLPGIAIFADFALVQFLRHR